MNAPPAALLDSRYRLGSVIARGGMSTVFRGVDTRLDRPVAIKIMDAQLAGDPAFRTRFEREARSAARIDHPAVVDVHDQGDAAGPDGPITFLVMELVEGGTLRDVLRDRGAVGVPAAVAVLEPVLEGLAEAHRLGLVHRDVKPENVLISGHGEVKVADFGLVTAAAQAGTSHAGMILGTVAYLSPEQVATGAANARSDVYAAGVLLYELLVGEPPYTGDTAISVAYRHVNCDVPAPSLIAGDVPPELDELVARATRRDPAQRPADASALLDELRRVGRQLEIPRVPVPVPPPVAPTEAPTVPSSSSRPAFGGGLGLPPGAAVGPGGTRTMQRPPEVAAPHPGPVPSHQAAVATSTASVTTTATQMANRRRLRRRADRCGTGPGFGATTSGGRCSVRVPPGPIAAPARVPGPTPGVGRDELLGTVGASVGATGGGTGTGTRGISSCWLTRRSSSSSAEASAGR